MGRDDSSMVMFDSDEAAKYRTDISGWVSRHGLYCGDSEGAARYDGCTHRKCEDCGKSIEKNRLFCEECDEARSKKWYESLVVETWDEKGMLYSYVADKFFQSWEEVDDYCEDNSKQMGDLRLVICNPNYLPLLGNDYGYDELAENGELPDSVLRAIDDFNNVIREIGPVSWGPSNKAASICITRAE